MDLNGGQGGGQGAQGGGGGGSGGRGQSGGGEASLQGQDEEPFDPDPRVDSLLGGLSLSKYRNNFLESEIDMDGAHPSPHQHQH